MNADRVVLHNTPVSRTSSATTRPLRTHAHMKPTKTPLFNCEVSTKPTGMARRKKAGAVLVCKQPMSMYVIAAGCEGTFADMSSVVGTMQATARTLEAPRYETLPNLGPGRCGVAFVSRCSSRTRAAAIARSLQLWMERQGYPTVLSEDYQ